VGPVNISRPRTPFDAALCAVFNLRDLEHVAWQKQLLLCFDLLCSRFGYATVMDAIRTVFVSVDANCVHQCESSTQFGHRRSMLPVEEPLIDLQVRDERAGQDIGQELLSDAVVDNSLVAGIQDWSLQRM
jgi:hypothetical protein